MCQSKTYALLVLIALGVVIWSAWPVTGPLLVAATIAGALYPLHVQLARRLRARPKLAAAIICIGVLALMILPLLGTGAIVARHIGRTTEFVRESLGSLSRGGVTGFLDNLHGPLERAVDWLRGLVPGDKGLEQLVESQKDTAAAAARSALASTGRFGLNTVLMLAALFFLLVDGKRLVAWLDSLSPLRRGEVLELLSDFRRVSVGVFVATVATAAIQAVLAFIGYVIARVPFPLSFGFLTFFLALVPFIGGAATGLVLALLQLINGHPVAAVFLALWSICVVGVADNVLKPLVMRGDTPLPAGPLFFALISGLLSFGAVGLLVGPLALAFLLATARLYLRARDARAAQPGSPAPPPQ
jgi:predicted PurR-regulated permease PerM